MPSPVYDSKGNRIGTARGLRVTVSRREPPDVSFWATEIEFDADAAQAVFESLELALPVEELGGELYPFMLRRLNPGPATRFGPVRGEVSGKPIREHGDRTR